MSSGGARGTHRRQPRQDIPPFSLLSTSARAVSTLPPAATPGHRRIQRRCKRKTDKGENRKRGRSRRARTSSAGPSRSRRGAVSRLRSAARKSFDVRASGLADGSDGRLEQSSCNTSVAALLGDVAAGESRKRRPARPGGAKAGQAPVDALVIEARQRCRAGHLQPAAKGVTIERNDATQLGPQKSRDQRRAILFGFDVAALEPSILVAFEVPVVAEATAARAFEQRE